MMMARLGRRFWEELAKEEARFRRTYYTSLADQLMLRFQQSQLVVEKLRWKGVGVTLERLRKEKVALGLRDTKNFITLDNLQLDQDEEAYLSLPYKFREYQLPDPIDFEVECELRWELMDREPPDEAKLQNRASAELDTQRRQAEEGGEEGRGGARQGEQHLADVKAASDSPLQVPSTLPTEGCHHGGGGEDPGAAAGGDQEVQRHHQECPKRT